MCDLLSEFTHEVERDAAEVGVADEIVEIEREKLEDETKMVAVFEVGDETNCV